ncbi:MAG: GDP-mannose 4,6-dehydratase [bacterium]|nr:GDP-mannose 4,6-dehydratase [bacterium]
MKLIITGINGFVGQHLAQYIISETKESLFGLDIQTVSCDLPGIILHTVDLMNTDQVAQTIATIQPDGIFHLAARTNVPESYQQQTATLMTNIVGTVNLLDAVRQANLPKCRIIIACSADQYGKVFPEELPIKESQPFRPLTPYAVSKIGQEMVAYQYYLNYQLPIIRIRAFNHTGPGQKPDFVCPAFAKQIADIEKNKQNRQIMVGNLDTCRDFTDVRDIVRAYWLAMERGEAGEVYNVCSGQGYSVREILNLLLSMTTEKIDIVQDQNRTRPVDVPILVGDNSKFKHQTGWSPQIPFHQTLSDLLEYYRTKA